MSVNKENGKGNCAFNTGKEYNKIRYFDVKVKKKSLAEKLCIHGDWTDHAWWSVFFCVFVSGSKVAESLNFTGKVIQHNIVLWVLEG